MFKLKQLKAGNVSAISLESNILKYGVVWPLVLSLWGKLMLWVCLSAAPLFM